MTISTMFPSPVLAQQASAPRSIGPGDEVKFVFPMLYLTPYGFELRDAKFNGYILCLSECRRYVLVLGHRREKSRLRKFAIRSSSIFSVTLKRKNP